jgi:hypothetical protein
LKNRVFQIKTNEGSYDLEASVQQIGKDWLVSIRGGEKHHIGAVAVAQPRPSLKDPNRTSASSSVICILGHKEDILAKAVAEALSSTLDAVVTVTAGIHWDNITEQGIREVNQHAKKLIDLILERLGKEGVYV